MERKILAGLGLVSTISLTSLNAETILKIISNLNLFQLIILGITGSVLIDRISFDGWKSKLPFYILKCPKHGYQISYPSGFNEALICPKCLNTEAD
jgi:hypothetical protein